MIKRLFNLCLAGTLLLTMSCTQQKKTAKGKVSSDNASKITYVSMERTSCFGRCPAYKTEINADGTVKYTSRSFTKYEGVYTTNVSTKDVAKLFAEFEAHQVDTCSSEYDNLISDVPGIIYHIKINGKDKEIMNAHFGPDYLKKLAEQIDAMATPDDNWKKLEDNKKD